MTTIAIDHDSISADGRSTDGDMIQSDSNVKVYKDRNLIYAFSGSVPDGDHLIDVVINGSEIIIENAKANLVTIENENIMCHVIVDGNLKSWNCTPPYALGSGEQFAIAAMDMGMTSKQAVKYAMTRDIYSGGKIKTIKYKKG